MTGIVYRVVNQAGHLTTAALCWRHASDGAKARERRRALGLGTVVAVSDARKCACVCCTP